MINAAMSSNLSFDIMKDFAPITLIDLDADRAGGDARSSASRASRS